MLNLSDENVVSLVCGECCGAQYRAGTKLFFGQPILTPVLILAVLGMSPLSSAQLEVVPVQPRVVSLEFLQLETPMYLWDGRQQHISTAAYRVVLEAGPFIVTDTDPGPQFFLDETPISVSEVVSSSIVGFIPQLRSVANLWYTLPSFRAPLEQIDPDAALSGFRQSGLAPSQVDVSSFLRGSRKIVSISASSKVVANLQLYEVVLHVDNFTEENFIETFFDLGPKAKSPDVVVGDLVGDDLAFSEDDQTISAVFDERPRAGDLVKLRYRHYHIPAPGPFPVIP